MGEKKRRLAAGITSPRFDERNLVRAIDALRRGDRDAALSALDVLTANLPHDPEALHAIGVIALQLWRSDEALLILDRAVAIDGANPTYRCHLAIACGRTGRPDRAITELEVALELDPSLAEAHANLGNLLLERDDIARAMTSFERALALRREFPEALNGRGQCELALGRAADAFATLERATSLDPSFHEAWYNRSRAEALRATMEASVEGALAQANAATHAELALECILTALQYQRANPAYWTQFERCVAPLDLRHPASPPLRDALSAALVHTAVDPARLARPIVSLVITQPDVESAAPDLAADAAATLDSERLQRAARAVAEHPLLQRLIEDTVVPDALIERVLRFARVALLREVVDAAAKAPFLSLSAIVTIAQHGFNGEYAADESAEERTALERLRAAIAATRDSGGTVAQHVYAVYACYRPLATLEGADAIATELASTALRVLAIRHIIEPREEERIRPTIAALGGVDDPVSAAVRGQYEERPYPRWQRLRVDRSWPSIRAMLARRFAHARLDGLVDGPARILVAGCGTGRHPIATAQRFPQSSILAVDLSIASLAFAVRKTRELGIGNVEYAHADLLALGALAERFDAIECTGVLHHLADPLEGWRTLASLLRPGGVMLIGLYSAVARRHVVRARELAASEGFAATVDGLRAFRRAVLARGDDPLLARLARGEDFYSLSGVRDLAFHVREHRYTLAQIAATIAELGLEFVGFELPDPATSELYRDRFPDDPKATDLDHWDDFERSHPDTFAYMYQFWLHKP